MDEISSYEITPNAIVWRNEFNNYLEKWGEEVYETIALIYNFDRIDTELLKDKEFLIDSIRVNPQLYDFLCEEKILQNDQDLKHAYWHSMVSIVGAHYSNINDPELYDNKNLALVAIEGHAIAPVVNFCSERLLDDEEVMFACACKNPEALSKASMRLKEDENFMLRVCKETSLAIEHIGPQLMADIGENNPLEYLINRFREDPEYMLKACKETSLAIELIGPQLMADIGEHDPIEYLTKRVENDNLTKQLSNKPLTKAQQLSNDIEGEGFTYKAPATTRTARTKL